MLALQPVHQIYDTAKCDFHSIISYESQDAISQGVRKSPFFATILNATTNLRAAGNIRTHQYLFLFTDLYLQSKCSVSLRCM